MTFKRNRMGDSSTVFTSDNSLPVSKAEHPTAGEEELVKQPYNPKKVVKQFEAETVDQSRRPRILTLPTADHLVQDAIYVGGFNAGLQLMPTGGPAHRCYFCKKLLRQPIDLFMYSGLAFCKAECRDSQIDRDMALSERYEELKQQLALEGTSNN